MRQKLIYWGAFAIITTIIFGSIYAVNRQNLRDSANDPQIQLAEDIADELRTGIDPTLFSFERKIDITKSLSTFIVVYDKDGKPLVGDAQLDNQIPQVPAGVLENAKKNMQNKVTWKPKDNERFAIVVNYYTNDNSEGYILVGRSLREIEKRDNNVLVELAVAWVVSLAVSLFALVIIINYSPRPKSVSKATPRAEAKTPAKKVKAASKAKAKPKK